MKTKILAVGESPHLHTGYAVYWREVLSRLHASGLFDLRMLATYAAPDDPAIERIPWPVYVNQPSKQASQEEKNAYNSNVFNQFGLFRFEQALLDFKPDVVLSAADYWMTSFINESPLRSYFRHCWLNPVDGVPQQSTWLDHSNQCDGVLTYTDWGRDILRRQLGNSKFIMTASPSADAAFRPIPNRREIKKEFGIGKTKIVGMLSRNQPRKCFPELMAAFRQFLNRTTLDVKLYLHTSFPDSGFDIPQLLLENELCSKVYFTYKCRACGYLFPSLFSDAVCACPQCRRFSAGLGNVKDGATNEELAFIYNLFDVNVLYSTNEGFGISQVEGAACGVPLIAVDYSAMSDVCRKLNGFILKPTSYRVDPDTGRNFANPDQNALVDKLLWYFSLSDEEQDRLGQLARQGFEKYYSWDSTANVWASFISLVKPEEQQRKWSRPPDIRSTPSSIPPGLSNGGFARWLILEVLGRPDLAGSYMELRIVRDLNYGITTGGLNMKYYNESSQMFAKPDHQEFTREIAFKHFCGLRREMNDAERRRAMSLEGQK